MANKWTKTHCKHGHEFTPENTCWDKHRRRSCRVCGRLKYARLMGGPEKKRYHSDRYRMWKYGISAEVFVAMLAAQNNCCGVCLKPFSEDKGMEAVVDHSHVTEMNRGLVHRKCNMALGLLQDDPVTCKLAAAYLEKYLGEKK